MGSGEVLMLVHGFGESGDIWDLQREALSKDWRLLIPDLPGSGGSTLPEAGDFELEDHARCLLHILDREGIAACTMVGHSMGGYITLAFAESFPERLNAMGLFHSTALPDDEERKALRLRAIDFMERHGAGPFLREAIPNLYAQGFRERHPLEVDRHVEGSVLNLGARALVSYYKAMMRRPDRRNVLSGLGNPVLMVAGEEDKTIILKDALSQSALPNECHLHVWPGVAHMGMREAPDKTRKILSGFMDELHR
jgi:pimeloyl-ACP methyl ester carboxylesterase